MTTNYRTLRELSDERDRILSRPSGMAAANREEAGRCADALVILDNVIEQRMRVHHGPLGDYWRRVREIIGPKEGGGA